jgi:hypothetical protein
MKQIRTLVFGLAVVAGSLVSLSDAQAWVAARGGWGGGVAVGGFHPPVYGGYHPPYYGGYHPPYAGGCYGCGAAVGAVAGMAVGAAIASSAQPAYVVPQPAPVYVQQPTYVTQGNLPLGTQVASLPPGAGSMVVNGTTYYQAGPTWYKPYFGSSGVYYEVVPAP